MGRKKADIFGGDQGLAKRFVGTRIASTADLRRVSQVCAEACEFGFGAVCVPLEHVLFAWRSRETPVKIICAVGLSHGLEPTVADKVYETGRAIALGADEISMIINLKFVRARDFQGAVDEVKYVVAAAKGRPVTLVLETHKLKTDEKIGFGIRVAQEGGAKYVQTCSGRTGGSVTVKVVKFMRGFTDEPRIGITATAFAMSTVKARALVAAGATRIGTSASVVIVTGRTGAGS